MISPAQEDSIDQVARALSDGTRRSILRLVRDDERSAGDVAEQFPTMSRPAVSQHLRVLHEAGLVTVRADGNRRMFRSRTEGLADMSQYLDEMWTDRLARLKIVAEREEWSDRQHRRLDSTDSRATSTSRKRAKPKPSEEKP